MTAALVIGGASGLGGVTAQLFARSGDTVLLADADVAEPNEEARFALRSVALDDADAPAVLVRHAVDALGGLDAVIVAAAQMDSAPLEAWTAAMWDRAAAINLRLPFLVAQAAAPVLAASGNASITFVSSTAARRGQPHTHAYQATKAALDGLTRSLAAELGPQGTRVNCVLPGWIETPLTERYWQTVPDAPARRHAIDERIPLRRHGTAGEVAAMLHFLASPQGRYISGSAIVIDGGDTAV